MSGLMQHLAALGAWNWFVLAVALIILETVVPGVHFIWFGAAAALVGGLALATGLPWTWQLIAFVALSVAAVFAVRRIARPEMAVSDEPDLNVRGAQYVGRIVTVEEPISSGRGKVRVGDTVWVAEGADAAKGVSVKVTGVNGTALVVAIPAS